MYQISCNGAIRPGKLERFDKVKYTKSTNLDCKAFKYSCGITPALESAISLLQLKTEMSPPKRYKVLTNLVGSARFHVITSPPYS